MKLVCFAPEPSKKEAVMIKEEVFQEVKNHVPHLWVGEYYGDGLCGYRTIYWFDYVSKRSEKEHI